MVWSLANHLIADDVSQLLDKQAGEYEPDVARFYSREQAEAIIHAALWGYGVRASSTAGCYAAMALFDAIGLKSWTFKEPETAVATPGLFASFTDDEKAAILAYDGPDNCGPIMAGDVWGNAPAGPEPLIVCPSCRGYGLFGGEPCDQCDGRRVVAETLPVTDTAVEEKS